MGRFWNTRVKSCLFKCCFVQLWNPQWFRSQLSFPDSLNNLVMIHRLAVSTRCKESFVRRVRWNLCRSRCSYSMIVQWTFMSSFSGHLACDKNCIGTLYLWTWDTMNFMATPGAFSAQISRQLARKSTTNMGKQQGRPCLILCVLPT